MKYVKIVSIVALIVVIALSVIVTKQQSESGCSITTKCSPEAREFIINKFGDANSIEDLLMVIDAFICTRTYIPKQYYDVVQTFDIDDFIANDCNGLCFDWSCLRLSLFVRSQTLRAGMQLRWLPKRKVRSERRLMLSISSLLAIKLIFLTQQTIIPYTRRANNLSALSISVQ